MDASELWRQFQKDNKIGDVAYEAWAFGGAPDKLAELVVKGIKIATSSLFYWYESGKENLPKAGDYSVILDAKGSAVCIIQTTKVYLMPFCEVSEEHAQKEGEGDLSLAYWQRVHEDFFSSELKTEQKEFDQKMEVVCEEFQLVYVA
ncbi:MAG: ASCH domain-containing protein [Candidatus Ventricola sp.]